MTKYPGSKTTLAVLLAALFTVCGCSASEDAQSMPDAPVVSGAESAADTAVSRDTTASGSFVIEFPLGDAGKDEHNAAVYEISPFFAAFTLPEGWQTNDLPDEETYSLLPVFTKVGIYNAADELVGAVGYTTYEEYAGAEDDPKAIYSQIALGNDYQFNVRDGYTVVQETAAGTTALAPVYYSASINGGEEKENRGILSYDREALVYVAMELDSRLVTEEEALSIAESLTLTQNAG